MSISHYLVFYQDINKMYMNFESKFNLSKHIEKFINYVERGYITCDELNEMMNNSILDKTVNNNSYVVLYLASTVKGVEGKELMRVVVHP